MSMNKLSTTAMADATYRAQDQSPYKPRRRMSATTTTTVTSMGSTSTSMRSRSNQSKPDLPLPNEQSNSLARIIAKDVVSSLFMENRGADGISDEESLLFNMSRLDLDLEFITNLVLAQVRKQHKGSDHELRILLRKGLVDDIPSEDYHEKLPVTVTEHSLCRNTMSTAASLPHITASIVSDISMATGSVDKSVDNYHTDFWSAAASDETPATTNDVGIGATNSTTGRSRGRSAKSILSSELEQRTMHTRASLHDLIQRVNDACSDSESALSDTCSVLSDITGLTGCFEPKEAESPLLNTFSDHCSAPKTQRSVVGSFVSSEVSLSKGSQKRQDVKQDKTRRVSFGSVNVRQYERIMCNNPSSTKGPSVGIGWKFVNKRPKEINEFEKNRTRKQKSQLMLSRTEREKIIMSLGYTEREIAATVRDTNRCRYQRRQTANNLGAQKFEHLLELAKRHVLKALFAKKT